MYVCVCLFVCMLYVYVCIYVCMPVQTKWFHDTGGDQVSQQFVFGCVVLLNASDFNLFQTYIFHIYRKLKFFTFPDGAAAVQGDGYQQPGRGWHGQQTGGGLQRHLQQRPQQRRGQQQLLHLLGGRHLGLLQRGSIAASDNKLAE